MEIITWEGLMEIITWEGLVIAAVVVVVGCFVAASIEVALEDRKRRREQAEREKLQRRGDTSD